MHLTAEQLRRVLVGGQTGRKRRRPEVESSSGGVRPPVQQWEGNFQHGRWHLEGDRLARRDRVFAGQARRIPRGHQLRGVRNRIVDLGHQLTETAVTAIGERLRAVNVR